LISEQFGKARDAHSNKLAKDTRGSYALRMKLLVQRWAKAFFQPHDVQPNGRREPLGDVMQPVDAKFNRRERTARLDVTCEVGTIQSNGENHFSA
jgi:hypothetical protein